MPRPAVLAALLLAAAPGAAPAQTELMACFAGIDMDSLAVRVEAFARERDLHARLTALCDAGDRDAAQAFVEQVETEFYGQADPDIAAMHACLEQAGFFEPDPTEPHPCDTDF